MVQMHADFKHSLAEKNEQQNAQHKYIELESLVSETTALQTHLKPMS